jgi:hypothetical protein
MKPWHPRNADQAGFPNDQSRSVARKDDNCTVMISHMPVAPPTEMKAVLVGINTHIDNKRDRLSLATKDVTGLGPQPPINLTTSLK